MDLIIHDILDKHIYVTHFPKDKSLKHSKTLCRVKNLEGCHSSQHIGSLIPTVVYPTVWIFIEDIKNRNQKTLSNFAV